MIYKNTSPLPKGEGSCVTCDYSPLEKGVRGLFPPLLYCHPLTCLLIMKFFNFHLLFVLITYGLMHDYYGLTKDTYC